MCPLMMAQRVSHMKIASFLHSWKKTTFDEDGHVEMPLPFRTPPPKVDTKTATMNRLKQLEKKFRKDDKYKRQYKEFMENIIDKGEAVKVDESEISEHSWYIPHFGIFHSKKPDKIRGCIRLCDQGGRSKSK